MFYMASCSHTVRSIRKERGFLTENNTITEKNKIDITCWEDFRWTLGHLYIDCINLHHHCIIEIQRGQGDTENYRWLEHDSRSNVMITDSYYQYREKETRSFPLSEFKQMIDILTDPYANICVRREILHKVFHVPPHLISAWNGTFQGHIYLLA